MRRPVVITLVVLALVGIGEPTAASAASARATVDGHYRIASTDCYFGAGACTTVFDIEQIATTLASPHDRHFHGRVRADQVRFGERFPLGTVEDGWTATGTTTDGGYTISGTMTDGIGGSGNFVMVFVRP